MDLVRIVVLVILGGLAVYFIVDSLNTFQDFRRRKDIYSVFGEDRSRMKAREILKQHAEAERRRFLRRGRQSPSAAADDESHGSEPAHVTRGG